MKLILSDNSSFIIDIEQNTVWDQLKLGYKHLQNVPIQFYPWDDDLHFDSSDSEKLVNSIVTHAKRLNINIDLSLCKQRDQYYLNYLHEIYEKNYDGQREWLLFHEHVHLLEQPVTTSHNKGKQLRIQWRDLAGPLKKDFKYQYLEESSTSVKKSDVYIRWQELAKPPYNYWKDDEPDDINRINELCKPWQILRHDFSVALGNRDFLEDIESDKIDFTQWWNKYHDSFCNYHKVPQWNIKDMTSVIKIGNITNVDELISRLRESIFPVRIKL